MGEVHLNSPKDSNVSDKESGLGDNDPPPIGVNRGTMTTERMNELVMRYIVCFQGIFVGYQSPTSMFPSRPPQRLAFVRKAFWPSFESLFICSLRGFGR